MKMLLAERFLKEVGPPRHGKMIDGERSNAVFSMSYDEMYFLERVLEDRFLDVAMDEGKKIIDIHDACVIARKTIREGVPVKDFADSQSRNEGDEK